MQQQRHAPSPTDPLTIAGLLVLGLTSALVGALVVAPTLAPKRLAMASELPEPAVSSPAPKQPADPSAAAINPSGNAPAANPAEASSSQLDARDDGTAASGTDPDLGNSPVSIRIPGEVVGPPTPPGIKRPGVESMKAESTSALERLRMNPDGNSVVPDAGSNLRQADGKSVDARRRRDSERKPDSSETTSEATMTPDSDSPETATADDTQAGDADDSEKGKRRTRVYRVQSGKFNTREEAQKAQLDLAKSGKGGFIVPAGDGFRLQLGVYKSRENAEKAADTARSQNIMVDVRSEKETKR